MVAILFHGYPGKRGNIPSGFKSVGKDDFVWIDLTRKSSITLMWTVFGHAISKTVRERLLFFYTVALSDLPAQLSVGA